MGPNKPSVIWPQYNASQDEYMLFKPSVEVVKASEERAQEMKFWNEEFYPRAIPKSGRDMTKGKYSKMLFCPYVIDIICNTVIRHKTFKCLI